MQMVTFLNHQRIHIFLKKSNLFTTGRPQCVVMGGGLWRYGPNQPHWTRLGRPLFLHRHGGVVGIGGIGGKDRWEILQGIHVGMHSGLKVIKTRTAWT